MLGAHTVTLSVNGTSYTREIEPTLLLVEFLRERQLQMVPRYGFMK